MTVALVRPPIAVESARPEELMDKVDPIAMNHSTLREKRRGSVSDAQVARFIGLPFDRDDVAGLEALRQELLRTYPGDLEANVMQRVILTKIRRLKGSN